MKLEILNNPLILSNNPENTLRALKNLKVKDCVKKTSITPEFILSQLPASYSRYSLERIINIDSHPLSPKLANLLSELNRTTPYFCHYFGIIYVPHYSNLNNDSIYFIKENSPKFQEFLANLGNLTKIKEPISDIGIMRKDLLRQVFFHISTLMQHTAETIKKQMKETNVVIIWNEGKELNETALRQMNDKVVIVIAGLKKEYYKVKTYAVCLILNVVCT